MTFVTFILGLLGCSKKSVSFADDVKGAPEEQKEQEVQTEVSNDVVQPTE
jgi:hypothetical protein